jgi:Ser/Thr protein kinase RdoA (MazF antagonist)
MQNAQGDAVYLDLTGIVRGPRIHDLAYASANLSFWSSLEWTQLPPLIRAYEDAAGWALSGLEREALPAYIAAVPLYIDICDWSDQPRRSTTRWLLDHALHL